MTKDAIHTLCRAIIIVDAHILLAYDPRPTPKHYYELNVPFHYLPGGHIEFKESAQQAIVREIEEETGHSGQCERFLGVIEHAWNFPGDKVCCHTHEINLVFKVHVAGITPQASIPQKEDHVAFQWFSLTELSSIDLRPAPLKTLIPAWIEADMTPAFVSTVP